MQKTLSTLALLVTGITLFSCKENTQNSPAAIPETPVVTMPTPVEVFSNDTLSVNGYKWEGLEHFLTQKNDTTYVVNFWATWCVPCVEELPNFEAINKKYKGQKVKVLLVSLDFGKDLQTKLLSFINRKHIESQVVVMRETDGDSWISKVDSTWSGALPATVIYKGDKRKFFEKSFTYPELETEINNFK